MGGVGGYQSKLNTSPSLNRNNMNINMINKPAYIPVNNNTTMPLLNNINIASTLTNSSVNNTSNQNIPISNINQNMRASSSNNR